MASIPTSISIGDGAPTYCGYTCWRGVTPHGAEFPRGEVFELWGAGQRFGGVHIDERMIENGLVDIVKLQTLARCGYMDYTPVEKVTSLDRPTWP